MSDKEEILKNIEKVNKLVDNFGEERKNDIKNVLEYLGVRYWIAPASSKEEFHYSFPGGLVKHSLNVFRNLINLNEVFDLNFNKESMLIVSLFHDLGKAANVDLDDYYVTQTELWRKEKLGENYSFNHGSVYLPNHQRSLFLLQHCGFKLKPEEYQAILLNDGMYLQENRGYGLKEHSLTLFLHMADRISLEQERTIKKIS